MKKKVLTKAMKKDVMEIIKNYIRTKQPEFDDVKLVKDFLAESQKKMQEFVDRFEYPINEEDKNVIKQHEKIFKKRSDWDLYSSPNLIKFDFDEESNSRDIQYFSLTNNINSFYTYSMPRDFLYLFEDKKDTYEYQKLKGVQFREGKFSKDLRDCYRDVYRNLFVEDFILKYKDLKKQYRNILTKFESIVFGTKYAVDLLEVINIPEVKTYIENQLKSDCTAISCVSKETIDFVKDYLSTTQEKDVD
jgi:hypothetical protein